MDERRRFHRISTRLPGQIRISLFEDQFSKVRSAVKEIRALVETVNISIGGLGLMIDGSLVSGAQSFAPGDSQKLMGCPIMVEFDGEGVTLWGEIVRVEQRALEFGVIIQRVSDVHAWKRLCDEHQEGISIFPKEWRRRRK